MQKKWEIVIGQTKAEYLCLTNKEDIRRAISTIASDAYANGIINPFGYDTAIKLPAQEEGER